MNDILKLPDRSTGLAHAGALVERGIRECDPAKEAEGFALFERLGVRLTLDEKRWGHRPLAEFASGSTGPATSTGEMMKTATPPYGCVRLATDVKRERPGDWRHPAPRILAFDRLTNDRPLLCLPVREEDTFSE